VDWGLAKSIGRPEGGPGVEATLRPAAADGSTPTQMGAALGTPAYMSPEQAAGRLDDLCPASDVYSLGATLYCLLTGKAPFTGEHVGAVLQKVQKGDFPPPRQVKEGVPAALQAVCLKAMALNPEDRYHSADALASEVERWLADEPVAAYREPWRVRLGRWMRRHRTAVTGVMVALTVTAVCLAAATVLLGAANRRECNAREEAHQQKERADHNLDEARKALRDLARRAASLGKELGVHDGSLKEAEEAYRQALTIQEKLARDFPAVRSDREGLARTQSDLGELLERRGRDKEAETVLSRGLATWKKLAQDFPHIPAFRVELAQSHNNLARLQQKKGRHREAEAASRRALAIWEKLAQDFPAEPHNYLGALASSHDELAQVLKTRGRYAEAEASYRRALIIREKLVQDFPTNSDYHRDLASSHDKLGQVLKTTGRHEEAEVAYRRTVAIWEKLVQDFDERNADENEGDLLHNLISSHDNLAHVLKTRGRHEEVEATYRRALAIREKLVQKRPTVWFHRHDVASRLNNLAHVLEARGRHEEAEATYRRALALREKLAQDFHNFEIGPHLTRELGVAYGEFASLVRDKGQTEAALEWYGKAITTLQAVRTRDRQATLRPNAVMLAISEEEARRALHSAICNAHRGRAIALGKLARHTDAVRDWERAIEFGVWTDLPRLRLARALALARAGDHGKAVTEARALAAAKEMPPRTRYDLACVYALASAAVPRDAPLANGYAGRAVELLTQARAAGFFQPAARVEYLKKDPDLAALRSRADFQKLAGDLEAEKNGRK
jgi:serine/threonine-protein kinase